MRKRTSLVALGLAIILAVAFSGCKLGKDGAIYGTIWWDTGYSLTTSGLSATGGFPSTVTKNQAYSVTPGSYYFDYDMYDTYYLTWSGWWLVTYSVAANPGTLFANGAEKDFFIDCYYYSGPSVYGTNIVETTGTKALSADGETIKTYSNGDYTITLKYKKIGGADPTSTATSLK